MPDEVKATKIIPDLPNALVKYVRDKLEARLVKGKIKAIRQYRGADVYSFGDSETGYVVLYHNSRVEYFVRYKRIRHNGFRLGRQILVWRNQEADHVTNGFARYVMFDILLPKFGALIADKEQTKRGASLWANALSYAFAKGYHCYFYDRRSRQAVLTPLHSDEDVNEHASLLWGPTQAHLLTFAVISKAPLQLKKKGD